MSAESLIQSRAIKYAKGLGFLAKRVYNGAGVEVGWPDVEFYMPYGKTLHIEFKAPGKEASKIQMYRIAALRALGHDAIVCDSFESAKEALDARVL